MMMTMNCFYGMVDRRSAFTPYFQPGPLSEILSIANLRHTRAGFEPAQNLSSDFVEWSFAVVITTTPRLFHTKTSYSLSFQQYVCAFKLKFPLDQENIVYKETDEWYSEWQRVTTNDNEWYNKWQVVQRVVQRMTTSDHFG